MYAGKLVFAQVMEFAPWHTFRRLVARYRGDFNVRTFSCLDQFLSMAFAQLTYRESLRDIEACLASQPGKCYHLGLRGNVTRSELFFKWIKQHLRIKQFFGTSQNAVKSQVWIAVATYVLVAIIKKRLNLDLSLHAMLQILSVTPFEKIPLFQLFSDAPAHQNTGSTDNQLILL